MLQAVVVIATLQEAWDHSRDITVMMTAIAAAVVQTTLSLTTTKTTVGSSSAGTETAENMAECNIRLER